MAVAERLAGLPLHRLDVLLDLVGEAIRQLPAGAHVVATGLGRDREARRHGDAELRHLRQPDPFAAEELPTALGWLLEVVHVGHLWAILLA